MKEQKNQGPSFPVVFFLSWFYTGKFPKAPGTIGSLATLPFIILLHYLHINIYGLLGLILGLTAVSIIVTEHVQKKYSLHDPQWIVIDEVIVMLITWAFVREIDFPTLFLVFGTFRFFDIIKIWPASYFDRIHHGSGTIIDDVISGLYAGIITLLVRNFL
jgi:phosphatidylglycerophosphatase A